MWAIQILSLLTIDTFIVHIAIRLTIDPFDIRYYGHNIQNYYNQKTVKITKVQISRLQFVRIKEMRRIGIPLP